MKIALINENSQAAKNAQIYEVLNEEAQKAGTLYSTTVCILQKMMFN